MKLKFASVLVSTLLLQACVIGPQYIPMTQQKSDAINKVDVYNLVIQDEVKPSVTNSNVSGALGGGLLGAVIDSSINKGRSATAQDIIAPLYNITEDVDYRALVAQSLNGDIGQLYSIDYQNASAETIILSDELLREKVNALDEGKALIYLSSFYQFFDDSKVLQTETVVYLYLGKPASEPRQTSGKVDPDYYNAFVYKSDVVGAGNVKSMGQWGANDADLFKKTLKESADKIADMLVYDMNPVLNEQCLEIAQGNYFNFLGPVRGKGSVINKDGKRATIREGDRKILLSLPEGELTVKKQRNAGKECESA